ncbi:MAG: biopolymer transporter ExbD [Bdellovibrionales bacterium]|nr:biopolymer transporter ExbD [Bdellovibrionales bacterium]
MRIESRKRLENLFDLTPLIDVVFLLLIFFMLTSTMMIQEGLDLDLPGSKSSGTVDQSPLVLSIDKSGKLLFKDKELSIDSLQNQLKDIFQINPNEPVVIKSDKTVPVQDLVDIMDAIRSSGGSNISLATSAK